MSYSVDELFGFAETEGGYAAVYLYNKNDDPSVTELEIPAEYHGEPVTKICKSAFARSKYLKRVIIPPSVRVIGEIAFYDCGSLESVELCEGLEIIGENAFQRANPKSVVLPKSLKELGDQAFAFCYNLESVEFNSVPKLGKSVFAFCDNLPADVALMSLTGSFDLSAPFDKRSFDSAFGEHYFLIHNIFSCFCIQRPDVLELAIKHDCFRSVDISVMLKFLIKKNNIKLLIFLEQHEMFESAALLNTLIEYSAEQGKTEVTAYLLDLKNRKFGFKGGENFEL